MAVRTETDAKEAHGRGKEKEDVLDVPADQPTRIAEHAPEPFQGHALHQLGRAFLGAGKKIKRTGVFIYLMGVFVHLAACFVHLGDFLEARLAQTKGARSGVTAIPQSSVVDSVRGPFVYVANNKSFLRTPVKLGAAQKGVVEVVDGLFEGDAIVTQGAPALWMVELQAVNGGKGCGDAH